MDSSTKQRVVWLFCDFVLGEVTAKVAFAVVRLSSVF